MISPTFDHMHPDAWRHRSSGLAGELYPGLLEAIRFAIGEIEPMRRTALTDALRATTPAQQMARTERQRMNRHTGAMRAAQQWRRSAAPAGYGPRSASGSEIAAYNSMLAATPTPQIDPMQAAAYQLAMAQSAGQIPYAQLYAALDASGRAGEAGRRREPTFLESVLGIAGSVVPFLGRLF